MGRASVYIFLPVSTHRYCCFSVLGYSMPDRDTYLDEKRAAHEVLVDMVSHVSARVIIIRLAHAASNA